MILYSKRCQRFYRVTETGAWRFLPTLETLGTAVGSYLSLKSLIDTQMAMTPYVKQTRIAEVGGVRHTPPLKTRQAADRAANILFG